MFDVRYHALTLVAVFVALAIGLLLGVAIGDEGLVSSAEQRLRDDLRGDVREARQEVSRLEEEAAERMAFERQAYPALVGDLLAGRRVALVFLGERSESVFRSVRDAIVPAGGRLSFVTTVHTPPDLGAIEASLDGTRFEGIGDDPERFEELGERLGRQLLNGGRLLRRTRPNLLTSSSGELGPAESAVVFRSPQPGAEDPADDAADRFVDGLVTGMAATGAPVVGVEQTTTEPSQIVWYQEHGLPTVDNINRIPGMVSLVFTLAGAADGHFGEKTTADAPLPDALGGRGG